MGSIVRFPVRDTGSKKPRERVPRVSEQRFRYPEADPVAEVSCDQPRNRRRARKMAGGRGGD